MKEFLGNNLKLNMHQNKVFIKTIYSGVDFLGWVHFSKHRVLRTSTKKECFGIFKRTETRYSYFIFGDVEIWKCL
jgi:hypothetical protein